MADFMILHDELGFKAGNLQWRKCVNSEVADLYSEIFIFTSGFIDSARIRPLAL